MTYTFKISKRLARMRAPTMLIALALAAACSAGEPTGPALADNDVADLPITLAPRQVTLEPGQTALFRAYERGASISDSLVTSVEWTATGGTIQSDGLYSSGTPGQFRVIGKKRGHTKQVGDTANIIVVPPQPNVVAVVASPSPATVPTGGQQAFTAVGKLSDGSTVAIGVEWTATGGTIDAGGTFTAGSTPGDFKLIAKAASANVADTVPVKVTLVSSAVTGGSHEPTGMNFVTARAYTAFGENGWYDGQPNGNFVITADPGAPSSTVGRMTFPAGSGTTWLAGNAPGTSSSSTLPADKRYRQIYIAFWLKVSSNWYGNPVVNKIGFGWIGGKPKFCYALQGGGTNPLVLQMRLQGLFSGGSDGAINLPNNLGNGTFSRGAWHFVEMVAVANSNGAANGQVYWWLDGQPVGSATNIAWVGATESSTWETVSWQPVWGGGAAEIPQDQYMYLDNFYASGK